MEPGFSPLDEELGLLPGRLTPRLVEHLVRLGTWMPFAPAATLLIAFTGVRVSAASARRLTEAAGAHLVAVETAAAAALAPPADPGPETDQRLQVSADGVMVALTDGTWAEVKSAAIGRVVLRPDERGQWRPHTEDLSYFARLAAADAFTRLAVVECHRRGVRAAAAVAGVQDGAPWLQGFLDYQCSDAVRILDFPHALEHIAAAGRAVWGPEGAPVPAWVQRQAETLKTRGPAEVLCELRRLQRAHPAAAPTIGEQVAYLATRVAQLDYPAFAAAGWPVGSGIVESANKLVVEARLKGAGMRWARKHVNPLLALRGGVCSDRWGEVWPQLLRAWQSQGAQQAAARRHRRHAAAPAPRPPAPPTAQVDAVVVAEVVAILAAPAPRPEAAAGPPARSAAGPRRPAANHPWRRSPIGKAARPANEAPAIAKP